MEFLADLTCASPEEMSVHLETMRVRPLHLIARLAGPAWILRLNSLTRRSCTDDDQSIEELRRPILAPLRQKVEETPNRREEIYASVVWVAVWAGVKRGFGGIEMMDFAVGFAAEHADARMLSCVSLNMVIRVETSLAARQQADFVPSPPTRPFSEFSD